jgi:Tol biopolymer transport system component
VLCDVNQGEVRVYDRPIYALAPDGKTAFSLNFARLQTHRPGYGYPGVDDPFADQLAPEADGIERIDLETGAAQRIVNLAELAADDPVDSMTGAVHYLNHIQVSPNGERLAFFHIWRTGEKTWRVRLYCMRLDGSERTRMLDTATISHYDWLDDDRLLIWAEHPEGGRNFLLCDRRDVSAQRIGAGVLTEDGHCTYSPDRRWVLNDTYPDVHDMRTLMFYRWPAGPRLDIARLYSPKARWWGELRCDLHPRWRRDGRAVCIDSVHDGSRQMYIANVGDLLA